MSLHRQIIVTGACTGGKSTFSHELVKKFHLQHIQIDPIIEGFEDVFPELGITHKASDLDTHEKVCQKFKPFLFRMIDGLKDDDFVIEGFRIPLSDTIDKYKETHQIFVFGFPESTPTEKVAQCRKYDVTNWTNDMTDEELTKDMLFLIEESKRMRDICRSRSIKFWDTGTNYLETIKNALEAVR